MEKESHSLDGEWLDEGIDSFDSSNIASDGPLTKSQRDRPLSLHWKPNRRLLPSLGFPPVRGRGCELALASILTEAVLAHEEGRSVSYSRSRDDYVGMGRYHGWGVYTYRNVTAAVAAGVEHGLLVESRTPSGQRGWRSTFRATLKLIEMLAADWARYELKGIIRLKDQHRRLVGFEDTDFTRRLEREMRRINEFLAPIQIDINSPGMIKRGHHWEIDGTYYRVATMAMYRVFNRSFRLGGRLYNSYQNIPRGHRPGILLDREPTVELDFRQLHAALLYDARGLRPPEDAYSVEGFSREYGKLAFNVGVNCAGEQRGTVAALLKKRGELDKNGEPKWTLSPAETGALVEAIWKKNAPIADALGSRAGLDLMNKDSRLAIDIIQGCRKAAIPVLAIHDGFRVPERHQGKVQEIIAAAASRTFNIPTACRVRVCA